MNSTQNSCRNLWKTSRFKTKTVNEKDSVKLLASNTEGLDFAYQAEIRSGLRALGSWSLG